MRPLSFRSLTAKLPSLFASLFLLGVLFVCLPSLSAEGRSFHITRRYLNIPISRQTKPIPLQLLTNGAVQREFPVQLAAGPIDYWIFIDVTEFKGKTITLSGAATEPALARIYQSDQIHNAASLYKEASRPQFHFTVKRGWNNDVNGPIFYRGQYHLFWQAFPFGVTWDTGYMYWGHAVSKDLIHWRELSPALMVDKHGAAWSGTAFVDHQNVGGWGKDALVLVYTAFDRVTKKQVQCIAYSTDNGATFTHFSENPVLDSNKQLGSNDTRDPKVFWYQPTHHWVMVLFEKDGMSFYTSTNLKAWTKKSHLKGLHECPDFFELPVDGNPGNRKWILHGGSSSYYIGSFDGETFTPESPELHYAEGKNLKGDDTLYAAQSFAEMPDHRRVQMAWGRVEFPGMPFNQMILFPTEFKLKTTQDGLRLLSTPITEIEQLHSKQYTWSSLTAADASRKLHPLADKPLQVKVQFTLAPNDQLTIRDHGISLATIPSTELDGNRGSVELLIDKGVGEIFVDGGMRYIVRELPTTTDEQGLEFETGQTGSLLNRVEAYELKSIWNTPSH